MPPDVSFGSLFKKYRLLAGFDSVSSFAEELAKRGYPFEDSIIYKWQTGSRVPKDRELVITVLKIFNENHSVNSLQEADNFLYLAGKYGLTKQESSELKNIKDDLTQSSKNTLDTKQKNKNQSSHIIQYNKHLVALFGASAFIFIWWVKMQLHVSFSGEQYFYNWTYGLINVISSAYGINLAFRKYRGFSTSIGKILIFLSAGLMCQWVGLQIWTYYNLVVKIEAAYPSLADFGYFMLIPFYSLAGIEVAKMVGTKIEYKKPETVILPTIIGATLFTLCFFLFIKNTAVDWSNVPKTLLDFLYPIGELAPLSIALYILYLSNSILNITKRRMIKLLVVAFILQFIAEYSFLIAISKNWYVNGGINDLLYPLAYFAMSLVIFSFGSSPRSIKSSNYLQ